MTCPLNCGYVAAPDWPLLDLANHLRRRHPAELRTAVARRAVAELGLHIHLADPRLGREAE